MAVLLVVGIAVANRWVARQRDRIAGFAAGALGRELAVQGVSLDLRGGIGLQMRGVSVLDAPDFGGGRFAEVPRVRVRLAFWPLLERRIEITRLTLEAPRLQIVRDAHGRWNYESLRPWAGRPRPGGAAAAKPPPRAAWVWLVAVLDIEDGQLDFVDRGASRTRQMAVRHWYVRARDVRLDRPFQFELRAAVDGDAENLDVRGEVGPVSGRDQVPLRLNGVLGPHSVLPLRVEIREIRGWWQDGRLEIESLRSALLGGEMELRATVAGTGETTRAFVWANGLDAQELARLAGAAAPDRIEGRVALEAEAAVNGWGLAALERSLIGTGKVEVAGGKLRRWNALRELSEQLPALRGFGAVLGAGAEAAYARALAREDTLFRSASARFGIADRQVRIEQSEVVTEQYAVRTVGSIDFSGRADLRGVLELSPVLSAVLASDAKLARYLMDRSGRVSVPFRYRGVLGEVTPAIDTAAIAERLPRRWLGEQEKELLPPGWTKELRDLLRGGLFGP